MQKKSVHSADSKELETKTAPNAPSNVEQNTTSQLNSEQVENGVRLVNLTHEGESWRLGSISPTWRNYLTSLGKTPTPEILQELKSEGIWLSVAQSPPKVAVVCGGQGTLWLHMGRELYDTLPAAREAMDRIAALASWDVLGLMDETDTTKLVRTRWQSPYIFLVSYAQACYLQSLGFKPDVYSGHSLGELVALTLADVYSLEEAWRLFDERSALVDDFEHNGKHDTGMMAVYASAEKVEETLRIFPELLISNYNTPTQYILSGPRDVLAEARRSLRKQKAPAITLNISMAFHHPHMRELREYSQQELSKFNIKAPSGPVFSNATASIYPNDKEGVVNTILDLDESAVRWVECVQNMWNDYNVRHFVELGPSDVIAGLAADIKPEATCLSVCRKGKELESMRRAVAELYALGHISGPSTYAVPADILEDKAASAEENIPTQQIRTEKMPQHVEDIIPILMEETGLERHKLAAHMDLRHDLAMRSSRFPVIIHKLESTFDIQINFEDLMHVATIGDLAQVVADFRSAGSINKNDTNQKNLDKGLQAEDINLIVDVNSIKEDMQNYPHVYPLGLTANELPTFYAKRNFSIYADALLQEQQSSVPMVTEAMMLEALYAGAALGFAPLNCYGADNIEFSKPFPCAGGITREGELSAKAMQWRDLDLENTLLCKTSLNVHDLTPNGRKMQKKLSMACANILFAKQEYAINSIWENSVQNLLDSNVIKECILPIKTFAPQCYSRYSLLPLSVGALKQLAIPEDENFDIISISRIRHITIWPMDNLRMFWKLQSLGQDFSIDAEVYANDNLILTMQGIRISDKDRS